jgi:hypothetical protein
VENRKNLPAVSLFPGVAFVDASGLEQIDVGVLEWRIAETTYNIIIVTRLGFGEIASKHGGAAYRIVPVFQAERLKLIRLLPSGLELSLENGILLEADGALVVSRAVWGAILRPALDRKFGRRDPTRVAAARRWLDENRRKRGLYPYEKHRSGVVALGRQLSQQAS